MMKMMMTIKFLIKDWLGKQGQQSIAQYILDFTPYTIRLFMPSHIYSIYRHILYNNKNNNKKLYIYLWNEMKYETY